MGDFHVINQVRDAILKQTDLSCIKLFERQKYLFGGHNDIVNVFLKSKSDYEPVYEDIPASYIYGCGRLLDAEERDKTYSMKESVFELIRGGDERKSWYPEVLGYFEGNLDVTLPGYANNVLRLMSIGGLVYSTNGSHRLPALYCWLIAKYGESAYLKKVYVQKADIFPQRLQFLLNNLSGDNASIFASLGDNRIIFKFSGSKRLLIYDFNEESYRIDHGKNRLRDCEWHRIFDEQIMHLAKVNKLKQLPMFERMQIKMSLEVKHLFSIS